MHCGVVCYGVYGAVLSADLGSGGWVRVRGGEPPGSAAASWDGAQDTQGGREEQVVMERLLGMTEVMEGGSDRMGLKVMK